MGYFVIVWYKTIYKIHFEQKFGWGFGYIFFIIFSQHEPSLTQMVKFHLLNIKPKQP